MVKLVKLPRRKLEQLLPLLEVKLEQLLPLLEVLLPLLEVRSHELEVLIRSTHERGTVARRALGNRVAAVSTVAKTVSHANAVRNFSRETSRAARLRPPRHARDLSNDGFGGIEDAVGGENDTPGGGGDVGGRVGGGGGGGDLGPLRHGRDGHLAESADYTAAARVCSSVDTVRENDTPGGDVGGRVGGGGGGGDLGPLRHG